MKRVLEIVDESEDVVVGKHHGGSFKNYMAQKVAKLDRIHNHRDNAESKGGIFHGCVAYVNGITDPPIEELRRIISDNSGLVLAYKTQPISHFICDYLTDAQLKVELSRVKFNSTKAKMFTVTAKWVTDSIKAKCRLPEANYIPPGLKGRHGGDIAALFEAKSRSTTSSSSSSAKKTDLNDVIELDEDEGPDYEGFLEHLSPGQRAVVDSLPEELRADAITQLWDHYILTLSKEQPAQVDSSYVRSSGEDITSASVPALFPPEDLQLLIDSVYSPENVFSESHPPPCALRPSTLNVIRIADAIERCIANFASNHRLNGYSGDALRDLLIAFHAHLIGIGDIELVRLEFV